MVAKKLKVKVIPICRQDFETQELSSRSVRSRHHCGPWCRQVVGQMAGENCQEEELGLRRDFGCMRV